MKHIIAVVSSVFLLVSVASAAELTQEHFDSRMDRLETTAEKTLSNTEQTLEALGIVLEGIVPKGGNLTRICLENDWPMPIVMGHNNIVDANDVKAGQKLLFPSTPEEMSTARKKGHKLYKEWLAKQRISVRASQIKVDSVAIDKLTIRMTHVTEELKIKSMKVDELKVRLVEITEQLNIKQANIEQLNIDQANLKQVNVEQMRIKQLEIDNLKELLAQAQARCAELEARPAKVVVKTVDGSSYVVPSDMQLLTKGGVCDEWPFSGNVTKAALKASGGQSVSIIELHDRGEKKSPRFKAKRLFVDGATGRAIPMEWTSNGQCIRAYDESEISQVLLSTLLAGSETLGVVDFTELNLRADGKGHGQHLTTAVFIIKNK